MAHLGARHPELDANVGAPGIGCVVEGLHGTTPPDATDICSSVKTSL
jgi:hypothetical protein